MKPATQQVSVDGINAHRAMSSGPAAPRGEPHELLRALASAPRFQAFLAPLVQRPMTASAAIEAVFGIVGAESWSDLAKPDQLARFAELLDRYESASRT